MPVVTAAREIEKLAVDQVLEVVATDPAAEPDLIAWSRLKGHEVLSIAREDAVVRVSIRKRASGG